MNAAVLLAAFINAIPAIFGWMAIIALLVLMPLACFQRTRPAAAMGFMLSLPLLAFLVWVSCLITVYAYWGLTSLLVATFVVGVGVVPAAAIAVLLDGTWYDVLGLFLMITLTVAVAAAAFGLQDTN
ncbi:MAG: hypothetical protein BGO51_08155 [Rhodospirillales bacterium 69-11]|nr:MAG: hypothetical protein BGO51_08155 [Rhodospirillales bacterium 69-11]